MQTDASRGRRRLLIDPSITVVIIVFLIGNILYASDGIIIYIFPVSTADRCQFSTLRLTARNAVIGDGLIQCRIENRLLLLS